MQARAIDIRLLFEADIPAAMQLKEAAGWNQTEKDWQRLLTLEPYGCFAALKDGRFAGTTTTTTYGNELAWIGMVLVDPHERRQGIATRLMNVALDYLNGKVATVKLDATAQGKPVYEKFGFQVESVIERWFGTTSARNTATAHALGHGSARNTATPHALDHGSARNTATAHAPDPESARNTATSHALDHEDVRDLMTLDRVAFNADRSKLIEKLIDDACVPPVVLRAADGTVTGYALARRGTNADYVGPVVVRDPHDVDSLLDQVLSQLPQRRVYIDLNTECGAGTSVLADRGFVKERELIRMTTGARTEKTSPLVVAIAGPETG